MANRRWVLSFWPVVALLLWQSGSSQAQEIRDTPATFTTLGTGAGPLPDAYRSQPSNLLVAGDQDILIDAGDGATQQIGKIGVPIAKVQTVFLSHLHFDHTGGLFAFLSRRYQLLVPGRVTIYGPPGTKATVNALLAAMAPALAGSSNMRARASGPPESTVSVVELHDGWSGRVGNLTVTAVTNAHYALEAAGPGSTKGDTFAFRFDTPGRSIVYTGDTGPSANVEKLARGADLLVAEIMDPSAAMKGLKAARPDLSDEAAKAIEGHFLKEHLSPTEVGLMARRAGVKALVLTHNAIVDSGLLSAREAIGASFGGPTTFAADLQRF